MGSLPCLLSAVSEDYKGAMHLSSLIIGELGEGLLLLLLLGTRDPLSF